MELMFKKMDEFMKDTSTRIKTLEHQIRQLASTLEQPHRKGEEDEEQKGEGPSECKSEDDNLIVKEDQEECPLMDMSKKIKRY
ncbi:hypothetical protein ACS0TY_008916 [Phlomoides rotata]